MLLSESSGPPDQLPGLSFNRIMGICGGGREMTIASKKGSGSHLEETSATLLSELTTIGQNCATARTLKSAVDRGQELLRM